MPVNNQMNAGTRGCNASSRKETVCWGTVPSTHLGAVLAGDEDPLSDAFERAVVHHT